MNIFQKIKHALMPSNVVWVMLVPINGSFIPYQDQRVFNRWRKEETHLTRYVEHFQTERAAFKFINLLEKTPLSKKYKAYILTDNEFFAFESAPSDELLAELKQDARIIPLDILVTNKNIFNKKNTCSVIAISRETNQSIDSGFAY